jgi:hypothetical protein
MATLVLQNVPSTLLERLELCAEELGLSPAEEALRLLRASLLGSSEHAAGVEVGHEADELLEEREGVLVFTGRIDPASIPSVHEVREQRVNELIRRIDEGGD